MMNRYYPSLKDIIYSTISIIHNNEAIQNPIVKSPIPTSTGVYLPIPIDRYRNYDGMELIEPGLTLSIFPQADLASEFKPLTVGAKSNGFMYEATYHLVIHLAYQELAINETKQLVYIKNKDYQISPNADLLNSQNKDLVPKKFIVPIEINVAEDILRDYLEVIRVIVEQIDYFAPWNLRGTNITKMIFPTTSWSAENKQIYFHQAYMHWDISTYAPATYAQQTTIKDYTLHTTYTQ